MAVVLRKLGSSDGEKSFMICTIAYIKHQSVTVRQTDRYAKTISHSACMACWPAIKKNQHNSLHSNILQFFPNATVNIKSIETSELHISKTNFRLQCYTNSKSSAVKVVHSLISIKQGRLYNHRKLPRCRKHSQYLNSKLLYTAILQLCFSRFWSRKAQRCTLSVSSSAML